MPSKTKVGESEFKVAKVFDNKVFSSKKWLREFTREDNAHLLINNNKTVATEHANVNCMFETDSSSTGTSHVYKDGYTMLIFDLILRKPTSRLLI
jgi:hypothetical protein